MMKYCCERFRFYVTGSKDQNLNIRIMKLEKEFLAYMDPKKGPLWFFINSGFEELGINTPIMVINYCPFCGKKLHKYYSSDIYVNEPPPTKE